MQPNHANRTKQQQDSLMSEWTAAAFLALRLGEIPFTTENIIRAFQAQRRFWCRFNKRRISMKLNKASEYFRAGDSGLAEFLGISRATLSRIRNGHRNPGKLLTAFMQHVGIELTGKERPKFKK